MMHSRRLAVAAGFLAVCAGLSLAGPGAPSSARTFLAPPEVDPPLPAAAGSLQVKFFPENANRPERTWVRLRAKRLEKKTDYTMWVDDPTVEGEDFVAWDEGMSTRGNGNVNLRVDTKMDGALPFGRTAAELAGAAFQLRNGAGIAVLVGVFPTLPTAP